MASVYSKRIAEFVNPAVGVTDLYTVPAGRVAILRDLSVFGISSGTNTIYLERVGGAVFWIWNLSTPYTSIHEELRLVLNAGDVLAVGVYSGDFSGIVSGYELMS